MPVEQAVEANGSWSVTLNPDTPWSIRHDQASASNYMFSTLVVTPTHLPPGTVSDSNLLATARYAGVLLEQSDDGYTLAGDGLAWWLGDNDNGDMYTGVDSTTGTASFSTRLSANVVAQANGLTAGTVNSTTGTISLNFRAGQTRRMTLDTLCAAYGYEWKINPNGSIDAGTQAELYDSNGVIFSQEGGRDAGIVGLASDLEIHSVSGRDYRRTIEVSWNQGTANGSATNTPPTTWRNFAGATPNLTGLHDGRPVGKPRGPKGTAPWRKIFAWLLRSQTRANLVATREANALSTRELAVTAQIDEYDPWRFLEPGDTVYVYDLERNLVDTGNQVYHRGSAVHPLRLRVSSWETPILEGYGVYLVRYLGAGGGNRSILDLTPYVRFEESTTSIELSTNVRFHRRNARSRRINRRGLTRLARRIRRDELLADYLSRVT